MSGIHISCGDWHSEENCGDAFPELVELLEKKFLSKEERKEWNFEIRPILENETATDVSFSVKQIEFLAGVIEKYLRPILAEHDLPDVGDFDSYDVADNLLDEEDAGLFVCAVGLLEARNASRTSGKNVSVYFA